MQSFNFPENFLRQNAAALYEDQGGRMLDVERLYMILFDHLPSTIFFHRYGKWINEKQTPAEFIHYYLLQRNYQVISEKYYATDFGDYIDFMRKRKTPLLEEESPSNTAEENQFIKEKNYFNRVSWRIYMNPLERILVHFNNVMPIEVIYDSNEPFYKKSISCLEKDYLDNILPDEREKYVPKQPSLLQRILSKFIIQDPL